MSLQNALTLRERLSLLTPFGVGQTKPSHFRDMLKVAWKNRDELPLAWKILSEGVCDGCALGVAGLYDWTMDGVHLCTTRLNLLRLNTMPALDHALLTDTAAMHKFDNAQLRELGRLAYPMLRRAGERGFFAHHLGCSDRSCRRSHPQFFATTGLRSI